MNIYELPERAALESILDEEYLDLTERFWKALVSHYVRNKGTTSLPYWSEQFEDPMAFNTVLYTLRRWIITHVIPERNWAEAGVNEEKLIEVFGYEQLIHIRTQEKIDKYTPKFNVDETADRVKLQGEIKRTGIVREGFAKASTTQFYYDVETMSKYREGIVEDVTKGMAKMRLRWPHYFDEVAYDVVSEQIVDQLRQEPELFTMEGNISDSRGRSIKTALKRVGNPIGFKTFRALLTIPEVE